MQARLTLIAIATLSAIASAQTIVLPSGFATTEGNTSSAHPFGRGNSATRVQYVYDSAAMVAAGLSGPVLINTIDWRANTAAITAGGTHAGVGVTLKVGTCAFDHLAITSTFDNNFATSTTYTLNPVTVATGAGTTPNNFTTSLTVPGGYLFDPAAGQDLVIEVRFPAGTFTGTAANTVTSAMDLHSATGVGGSRVFTTSDTAITGTVQTNLAAVIQLGYTPAAGAATSQSYGTGCGAANASIYQNFTTSAAAQAALQNTAIAFFHTGSGFLVTNSAATLVPPSGTATALALTDDSEAIVPLSAPMPVPGGTTSSLAVCSNGFVSVATGNGTGFNPTAATMLAAPQTGWWSQHDYNPTLVGSGQVKFEEVGGIAYVTWDGVYDFGGTTAANANTFQFQFDLATGNVVMVWGTMSGLGIGHLVGYSPGGASVDPGQTILATGLPVTLVGADVLPLSLSAGSRPVVNTTVTYTVSNINPGALISAQILSLGTADPGIPLDGIGMPGCFQYVDTSIATTNLLFGGPSASITFSVPNDPNLTGVPLDCQAASLVPGINALGALTSNGVASVIGTN